MFLYRDEVYNPDTEAQGEAEVIIGKQRNGPTGAAHLLFQGEYSRFSNLIK
jgi:replicative DNA helicase